MMNEEQILTLIKEALVAAAPSRAAEVKNLDLQTSSDKLPVDSLTTIEMVSALEARLGVSFSDEDLLRVRSLRDLVALIQRTVGSAQR
jgi:acyl carrier protein